MDYDKLIEQLKKSADFEDYPVVASFAAIIEKKYLREAATALSTLQAENEELRAELEQVKAERDAAIEYLREIEWCAGCKHFGGLDGCKKWAMGQCTEKHDLYEFVGPKKED